jgi:hypothetical protein
LSFAGVAIAHFVVKSTSRKRNLRIFISSPGDVSEERSIVRRVIRRLGETLPEDCVLLPVDWNDRQSRSGFLATLTPQQAIERGLPTPDKCSIVVVVLWSRIGTPLDPERLRKPDGTPYLSGTEYEYEIAAARARTTNRPSVLVFRRTKTPSVELDDPHYEEKGRQWKQVKEFFSKFQKADGSWIGSYELYEAPAEFERLVEALLKREIDRILADQPDAEELASFGQSLWKGSPFPGLRAFQPEDAPIFFGRESETDQLIAQLAARETRFLAVVGASGSGKSSLVRAGLIPRLMENAIDGSSDWRWGCFTPGGSNRDPFLALAGALAEAGGDRAEMPPAELAVKLAADPENATAAVDYALREAPTGAELLLVIDQLEELFTIVKSPREAFIDFIDQATHNPRIRIVTTFRADFYHRCIEIPKLAQLLRAAYPLPHPDAVTLNAMIRRPAEYAGLEFEGDLAQQILKDAGTNAGSLALMAYLLDELYRESAKSGTRMLTYAAYEALGRVKGAIAHRAEESFEEVDPEARDTLPLLVAELAQVDERGVVTRQRAPLDPFVKNPPAIRLIEKLTQHRLLVRSPSETQEPMVEIGHEALLQSWGRMETLIRSTLEDRRLLAQMRTAAEQWDSHGKSAAFLWTHDRAEELTHMLARLNPSLSETESTFARPEAAHLLDELLLAETTHDRRAFIADRLDKLGDPRAGVGILSNGSPDLQWVRIAVVPQSSIYSSGDSADVMIEGVGAVSVRSFFIARYPVTYGQYLAFLEAEDGFRCHEWWKGLEATETHRLNPGVQGRRSRNHPAENVSWYDATAACRWMSARLGYEVRLPEEAEWQFTAGANRYGLVYPWGEVWRSTFANTFASGLNRTIACGMYPQGASPYGVLDMCGNVCEWTATPGYEAGRRILRGGSWNHLPAEVRIMARESFFPYERRPYCGFRVACTSLPNN